LIEEDGYEIYLQVELNASDASEMSALKTLRTASFEGELSDLVVGASTLMLEKDFPGRFKVSQVFLGTRDFDSGYYSNFMGLIEFSRDAPPPLGTADLDAGGLTTFLDQSVMTMYGVNGSNFVRSEIVTMEENVIQYQFHIYIINDQGMMYLRHHLALGEADFLLVAAEHGLGSMQMGGYGIQRGGYSDVDTGKYVAFTGGRDEFGNIIDEVVGAADRDYKLISAIAGGVVALVGCFFILSADLPDDEEDDGLGQSKHRRSKRGTGSDSLSI